VLVNPNDGSIDDRVLKVGIPRQGLESFVEHAASGPSPKPLKDGVPVPEKLGKVAPGCSNTRHPQNSLEEKPVVCCRAAWVTGFPRKTWRNPLPLVIAQNHTIQGHLLFGSLEANFTTIGNPLSIVNVNRP
jgi:hypothetical protein